MSSTVRSRLVFLALIVVPFQAARGAEEYAPYEPEPYLYGDDGYGYVGYENEDAGSYGYDDYVYSGSEDNASNPDAPSSPAEPSSEEDNAEVWVPPALPSSDYGVLWDAMGYTVNETAYDLGGMVCFYVEAESPASSFNINVVCLDALNAPTVQTVSSGGTRSVSLWGWECWQYDWLSDTWTKVSDSYSGCERWDAEGAPNSYHQQEHFYGYDGQPEVLYSRTRQMDWKVSAAGCPELAPATATSRCRQDLYWCLGTNGTLVKTGTENLDYACESEPDYERRSISLRSKDDVLVEYGTTFNAHITIAALKIVATADETRVNTYDDLGRKLWSFYSRASTEKEQGYMLEAINGWIGTFYTAAGGGDTGPWSYDVYEIRERNSDVWYPFLGPPPAPGLPDTILGTVLQQNRVEHSVSTWFDDGDPSTTDPHTSPHAYSRTTAYDVTNPMVGRPLTLSIVMTVDGNTEFFNAKWMPAPAGPATSWIVQWSYQDGSISISNSSNAAGYIDRAARYAEHERNEVPNGKPEHVPLYWDCGLPEA